MNKKIYIADDNSTDRKLLAYMLEDAFPDYDGKICEFDNGKSLYEKLMENNEEVKVVLTDNNMPLMRGLEVIQKCASLYPDIAFISMSAKPIREKAISVGAKDFLFKPFDFNDLESVLKPYL